MITKIINIARERDYALSTALDFLRAGEVIGFPTETVYGLGADAGNIDAVSMIFTLKKRNPNNPVSLHLADAEDAELYCSAIPKDYYKLSAKFLPGPLAVIMQKKAKVHNIITGHSDKVGIRIPDDSFFHAMALKFGKAIAATSANLSGFAPAKSAEEVFKYFEGNIPVIYDGGISRKGKASTVIDLTADPPVILRQGGVSREDIEDALGKKILVK